MRADRQLRRRVSAFVAAATVAVSSWVGAGVAQAQAVVNQGDLIYLDIGPFGKGMCTVGYVDRAAGKILTAAHCVNYPGQRVTDAHGRTIGHVSSLTSPLRATLAQNDYAYITLRGAVPGVNGFSGDAIVHPSAVRPGDEVCAVGARTQRQSCGRVGAVRGHVIFGDGLYGDNGDSGGPVWIPGRGLVGVASSVSATDMTASAPFYYFGPELLLPLDPRLYYNS